VLDQNRSGSSRAMGGTIISIGITDKDDHRSLARSRNVALLSTNLESVGTHS